MIRTAFVFLGLCGLSFVSGQCQEVTTEPSQEIQIGVYDSRAIAVAWAGSKYNPVKNAMKELEAATDANDSKKIAELQAWGKAQQRLLHFQGFGRVPVGNLLDPVRPQIQQLISDKNLVAIAMDCDEVAANVEKVDVTMDLVNLYEPSAQTLKWVEQLRDTPPVSLQELAELREDK